MDNESLASEAKRPKLDIGESKLENEGT